MEGRRLRTDSISIETDLSDCGALVRGSEVRALAWGGDDARLASLRSQDITRLRRVLDAANEGADLPPSLRERADAAVEILEHCLSQPLTAASARH